MKKLTEQQVHLIRKRIRQGGIEMSELEDDLLDHVCCAVEEKMEDERGFDEALAIVLNKVCPNGFREIQEETNYLLTLKFKAMKKTMNILGVIGTLFLLLGTIFKMQHYPGAGIMIVSGGFTLGALYLPLMLYMQWKQADHLLSRVKHVVGFCVGSAFVAGTIIKIMHWPGANVLLLGAIGLGLIAYLPLYLKTTGKDLPKNVRPATSAVMLFALLSLLFAFSNQHMSYQYMHSLAKTSQDVEKLYEQKKSLLEEKQDEYAQQVPASEQAKAREIHQKARQLVNDMDGLKADMWNRLGAEKGKELVDLPDVAASYTPEVTHTVMLGEKGKKMADDLMAYTKSVQQVNPHISGPVMSKHIEVRGKDIPWLAYNFKGRPVFSVFSNLSRLQLHVLEMRDQALEQLASSE